MAGDDFARVLYLILLLAVIGGYFLLQNRRQMGQMVQQMAIWLLIIIGLATGWGLWSDLQRDRIPQHSVITGAARVEVPRAIDGHYYLTLELNGTPVRFVVDTGATDVVLTTQDAARIGIDPADLGYFGQARTANGTVRTARIRIDEVTLGEFRDTNLTAWVNEGQMETSLLGMAYLNRFERIEMVRDRLILSR
ncbi:TIGR02281 family clan AA aspartic protease [Plastorhodobacter daqingensis]|uniref:TIGR02281 family clan AA aspartic protease n=1 Tax=Plastorhodobacter daqingensis TaxID=1387281 RepID=A0ABW2ULD3_9RHOB